MTASRSGRIELPNGAVAFYGARWKMVLLLLACLSFVAISGVVLATSSSLNTVKTVGLWAAVVLFLLCAAAGLARLVIGAPAMMITQSEVFATSMFGKSRPGIPLDHIDHVVVLKFNNNVYLAVVPSPEIVDGLAPALRRNLKSNQFCLGIPAAIAIAQVMLGSPAHEVATELAELADCPLIDMLKKRATPVDADTN